MIPSSFLHGHAGGCCSSFPPVNQESMMFKSKADSAFDSSLDKIMVGVTPTSAPVPSSVPMAMVPPPPHLSRIIASKRLYSNVELSEATTTTTTEALTPGFINKDAGIQQQQSSSSNRRDSLLAALALGSTTTAASSSSCMKQPEQTDLKQQQNDLKQPPCLVIKKRKRRVCFAELATCYPPPIHAVNGNSCITPQEQEAYWYSRQDLGEIKRSAKRSCQGLNLDRTLNKVYNKIAFNQQDDDDDDDNMDKNNIMVAQDLHQLQDFETQRGLERWSSRFQMFSRCVTIIQAKTEVMLEQVNQQVQRKHDPEQLRQAVQLSSRKSARYAHLLGLVDAQIASGMNNNNDNETSDITR